MCSYESLVRGGKVPPLARELATNYTQSLYGIPRIPSELYDVHVLSPAHSPDISVLLQVTYFQHHLIEAVLVWVLGHELLIRVDRLCQVLLGEKGLVGGDYQGLGQGELGWEVGQEAQETGGEGVVGEGQGGEAAEVG